MIVALRNQVHIMFTHNVPTSVGLEYRPMKKYINKMK